MKTTLIVNVAASEGGALSILKMYYEMAKQKPKESFVFVISTPVLAEKANIKIIRLPKVKKSWLHRLYFDKVLIKKIVKEVNPDEIISLQNIYVGKQNTPQTVYIHQSIPFSEHKFKIYKNPKLWIYQNIIGLMIKRSIKKADKIIVQTEWMKEECLKYTDKSQKIIIEFPKTENYYSLKCKKDINYSYKSLFYPASSQIYKNHITLLKALKKIKEESNENIKLYLTLSKYQNRNTKKLSRFCEKHNLNVEFVGTLKQDEMFEYYCSNILVFPSYIETIGLPLLEAQQLSRHIIVTNEKYALEIMKNYKRCDYFYYQDVESLTKAITNALYKYSSNT